MLFSLFSFLQTPKKNQKDVSEQHSKLLSQSLSFRLPNTETESALLSKLELESQEVKLELL